MKIAHMMIYNIWDFEIFGVILLSIWYTNFPVKLNPTSDEIINYTFSPASVHDITRAKREKFCQLVAE